MCFLAVLNHVVPRYPLIVAANRDEFLDRPGRPPGRLAPGVWGGSDPRAGGTWLCASSRGLVAAVANIVSPRPPDPAARSRGLLCLDAAGLARASDFPDFIRGQVGGIVYNPFNVVVADRAGAWLASFAAGRLAVRELGTGTHLVANSWPNYEADPKVAAGRRLIAPTTELEAMVANLQFACRYHGEPHGGAGAICVHGTKHGTLSSTVLAIHEDFPRGSLYLHAAGPPCRAAYEDFSDLFLDEGR